MAAAISTILLGCHRMPVIRSWARTDVGHKRKHNEDSFLNDDAFGLYLFRNGRAHQLTEDHTIIQEQLKRGLITKEQIPTAENKNVITRAVGIQEQVAIDTLVTDLLPGDLFLLCSDGLHGYLTDEEVAVQARSEEHTSELQSRQYLVC